MTIGTSMEIENRQICGQALPSLRSPSAILRLIRGVRDPARRGLRREPSEGIDSLGASLVLCLFRRVRDPT